MKRLGLALALLWLAPTAFAQDAGHATEFKGALPDTGGVDPKKDPRVVEITSTLACNCGTCPHEPLNVCNCGTATRLRAEIAAGISRGETKDVILAALIAAHGETILPTPPLRGLALVAYLGPFIAIVGVGFWIGLVMRRWSKKAGLRRPEPGTNGGGSAEKDPYLAAVEAELRADPGDRR